MHPGLLCQKASPLGAGILRCCFCPICVISHVSPLPGPCLRSLLFQTDETGCYFTNVSLSSFSRDFRYYQDSIVAEALLVENGTGNSANSSGLWEEACEDALILPRTLEPFRLVRALNLLELTSSPLGAAI